jgi:hypothetical protein
MQRRDLAMTGLVMVVVGVFGGLALPSAVVAQQVDTVAQAVPVDSLVPLEGILVTAQKREQRLIDVPIAVSLVPKAPRGSSARSSGSPRTVRARGTTWSGSTTSASNSTARSPGGSGSAFPGPRTRPMTA